MLFRISPPIFRLADLLKNCLFICLIGLVFCFPVYSQWRETKSVSVHLETTVSVVKKTDSIKFDYTVQNNSAENFYLIMYEAAAPFYNSTDNKLGLDLWQYSLNEEVFRFPKLKKLKPKQWVNLSVTVPVAKWGDWIKPGKFSVEICVGLLSARDVKGKNLKGKSPSLYYEDFMKLTQESYSNRIQIEITD